MGSRLADEGVSDKDPPTDKSSWHRITSKEPTDRKQNLLSLGPNAEQNLRCIVEHFTQPEEGQYNGQEIGVTLDSPLFSDCVGST